MTARRQRAQVATSGHHFVPLSTEEHEEHQRERALYDTIPDYHHNEGRHSAAHRHSAIKTHHRVTRKKKHSENQQVNKQIKEEQ